MPNKWHGNYGLLFNSEPNGKCKSTMGFADLIHEVHGFSLMTVSVARLFRSVGTTSRSANQACTLATSNESEGHQKSGRAPHLSALWEIEIAAEEVHWWDDGRGPEFI